MIKDLKSALLYPVTFVLILLLIHLYGTYYDVQLSHLGVYPRKSQGLPGIVSMIFVHGSWKHLFNNSVPLLVLGTALFHFYKHIAPKVTFYSILFTGLLVWLGARPSYHIGASGLVYALASFLFLSGLLRKHRPLMALSMFVVFLYGGLIWGIFPNEERISWEGHLFGAISGLFWALYYKDEGPQRKKYSWEIEEEILKSLEGIEVHYEKVSKGSSVQNNISIQYDFKERK